MTIYYDPTLAADAVGSYSVANRDTSGSETAYKAMADAITNKAGGAIILRGGSETHSASVSDAGAGDWQIYDDETVTWTFTGDINAVLLQVPNIIYSTGKLLVQGTGAGTTKHGVRLQTANQRISCGLIDFSGWSGIAVGVAGTSLTLTIDRLAFDSTCERPFRSIGTSCIINIGCMYTKDKGISDIANNNFDLNVGQWFMNGSGVKQTIEITSTNTCQLVIDNALILGANSGAPSFFAYDENTNGSITINNSIAHSHLYDPAKNDDGVNLPTFNNCDDNSLVKFENFGGQAYVVIGFYDSSTADTTSGNPNLDDYIAATAANGAKLTYFPDDADTFDANGTAAEVAKYNASQAWIAAGHEFAMWGRGGGDAWDEDALLTITYTGVGVGTIRISTDGTLLELLVDDVVTESFDTSTTGAFKFLNYFNTTTSIYDEIKNNTVDWTATETASNTYDDAYAIMLASGTYASGAVIPFDVDRRFFWEITDHRAHLTTNVGTQPESFLAFGGQSNAPLQNYVKAEGLSAMVAQGIESPQTPVDTMDIFNINPLWNTTTNLMFTGRTEAETKKVVRRYSSYLYANGGVGVLMMAFGVSAPTQTEITYLTDELIANGVQIITANQLASIKGGTVGRDITQAKLTSDSAGVGYTKTSWSGSPNPIDMAGEPFADFETDCGIIQSDHNASHPTKL